MIKLQIAAGKATPAPPVGPALGQHGVNIMDFCKQFNAKTSGAEMEGLVIPVVITVFGDRSFTFITKTPPAAILLKRAAGIAKGIRHAACRQSGDRDRETGRRDCAHEIARLERDFSGVGDSQRQRDGPQHGNRCNRLGSGQC